MPTEEIEKLTFNRFIMTIGNLPSSYVESLSYYECMLWLCDYLQNTVIPAVNNNGEVVEELQGLYVQLKNYVDSYFTDLDVQEEINNKLDEMVQDGTLITLISSYIAPYIEAQNEEISDFKNSINEQLTQFENSVNSDISSINSAVQSAASGSPAGVYATVAALTSADPDHSKIYLVTDDGKWYYYSSGSWTAGGTYQATDVASESIFVDNFEENIQDRTSEYVDYRLITNYTETLGKYMRDGHNLITSSLYENIEIDVKENDVIYILDTINTSAGEYTYMYFNGTTFVSGGPKMNTLASDSYSVTLTIPAGVTKLSINFLNRYSYYILFKNVVDTKTVQTNVTNTLDIVAPFTEISLPVSGNAYVSANTSDGSITVTNNSNFLYKKYDVLGINHVQVKYTNDNTKTVYAIIVADHNNKAIAVYNYMQNVENGEITREINLPTDAEFVYVQSSKTGTVLCNHRVYLTTADIKNVQNEEYMDYAITQLERRCSNLENQNPFDWATFDKTYFCFVIDDCNAFFPKAVEIFHNAGVPLSSATLVNKLDEVYTTYTPSNTKTVKELLDDMVAEGGEVLAHYTGNLAPAGTPDSGGIHYLTSDDDWLARTRDVKMALEDVGFTVRGIIRADQTIPNTSTGQKYCQLYFDYSDGLGTSLNFDLKRKFFLSSDMQTLAGAKAYIDQCCQTPGFYPFCFHGTRQDEPLVNESDLNELLSYIANKGSSICVCSTYNDVINTFGSTELEQRIANLE